MTHTMLRKMIGIVALALVAGSAPIAASDTSSLDATAEIRVLANGVAVLDPVDGVPTRNILVHVENHADDAPILMVTVHALGPDLATVQPVPPAPWAVSWSREAIQFLGTTGTASTVDFLVRVQSADPAGAAFRVDIQSIPLATSIPLAATSTSGGGRGVCQVVAQSAVDGKASFAPFGTLSSVVPTSAKALVAVYDTRFQEYVAPSAVTGSIRIETMDKTGDAPVLTTSSITVPLNGFASIPVRATPLAPVLDQAGASVPVRAATLWDGPGAARDWFVQNPGPVRLLATARVAGASSDACALQPYDLARSVSPLTGPVGAAIATPFTLVPPELDSDGDGYANVNELRGNSNPLVFASTPYTDDDGDGVMNAQDPVPTLRPLT